MTQEVIGLPGIKTERPAAYRNVCLSDQGKQLWPGGATIDGSKSRDPLNSSYEYVLEPGLVMGRITSGGKFAPSIIGVTTNAETGASTSIEAAAGVVTELVRRLGASGTFKITGPPTAAGTVRTLTATYSAASGTAITVTALGVADVWTLTAPAGQDGGTYQLEITTGKGTSAESVQTTVALAANANSATVDAALEALTNVGASGVAAVYADPTLTLTFASNLGPVHVRVLADTTNDGGVFEGGWAAVHTTTGVDGRFVAGSFIQPVDGSETPKCLINDGSGVRVVDRDLASVDTPYPEMLVGGLINSSAILNWPSDTSLQTWLKNSLNAAGHFTFKDTITG